MNDAPPKLPTRFDPGPAEARWYRGWLAADLFRAAPDDPRPPYSLVIPPPNVTGSLHLGHALNNTLQDVLARHKRLAGMNVLWMPGTDHAGIATQVVVERELAKQGKTRHDLGREAFVDLVWEWKTRHGSRIIEQLQAMGFSCDWSRERFTMDPGLSRAVREVFVRLWREGLVYRAPYLVNWCPRCMTVLSDLESPYRPVDGRLYSIRYPLADGSGSLTVATTRPETMLGDTAVAVHPEDQRYAALVGRMLRLPLLGREIPIVTDAFVDREFGSGAVKVTPGHDPNDFECGRRLGLATVNILRPNGTLNENAGAYAGLPADEARRRVVADLEAQGLLAGTEPHAHEVPHCDRCDTRIEPLVSEQWFVRMETLAKPALEAVRDGRTTFTPRSFEKTYFQWLENVRPWAISRQLWWGHRIPAWRCSGCREWTVSVEDPVRCEHCGGAGIEQESDVLDTWFSSALWPFSTMGWPDETRELRVFYPTSVLSTGPDIIFFWVARMMMMGLHFMGDVPFRDVYIHPLVVDEHGKKMSKSRGNTIDPLEVMGRTGADALRFAFVSLAAQGRPIRLSDASFEGPRAFVTKLWNAARFALIHVADHDPRAPAPTGALYDRWIRTRLDAALAEAHRALAEYRFNDAASALYQFVWGELCDWYIELAKLSLSGEDEAARRATQRTLLEVLAGTLAGLHPIMPFVTEEIFQALPVQAGEAGAQRAEGERRSDRRAGAPHRRFLIQQGYPEPALPLTADEKTEMETFAAVVAGVRGIRGELGLQPRAGVRLGFPVRAEAMISRHARGISSLTGATHLRFSDAPAGESTALTRAGDLLVQVDLDDPGLLVEEQKRLAKVLGRLEKDLEFNAKRLDNPEFSRRARPEIVAAEREKRERLQDELRTTRERLDRLSALTRGAG